MNSTITQATTEVIQKDSVWIVITAIICTTILLVSALFISYKNAQTKRKTTYHPFFYVIFAYLAYVLIVIFMRYFEVVGDDFTDNWIIHVSVLILLIIGGISVYIQSQKKPFYVILRNIKKFLDKHYHDEMKDESLVGHWLEGFQEFDSNGMPKAQFFVIGKHNTYTFEVDMISGQVIGVFLGHSEQQKKKLINSSTPKHIEDKVRTSRELHGKTTHNDNQDLGEKEDEE